MTVTTWKSRSDYYEKKGYTVSEAYNRSIWTGHFWSNGNAVPDSENPNPFSLYYRDELVPPDSSEPYDEAAYKVTRISGEEPDTTSTIVDSNLHFDKALRVCRQSNVQPDGRESRSYTYIQLMDGFPSSTGNYIEVKI